METNLAEHILNQIRLEYAGQYLLYKIIQWMIFKNSSLASFYYFKKQSKLEWLRRKNNKDNDNTFW